MKCPRRKLGALGEPAHVGRIIVGGVKRGGAGRVSKAEMDQLLSVATAHSAGAATVYRARGKWRSPDTGRVYNEPSTVIEVVGSAADSCGAFTKRMRAIGARAAAIADQESVLALTSCNGGEVDASLVTRAGRAQALLPTLRRLIAPGPQQRAAGLGHLRSPRRKRKRT